MPFTIEPCSPEDATGLASVMVLARLTDPHWAFLWEDPRAEVIIPRSASRLPWNLVNNLDTARHEKLVDSETGEIIGYARWSLPPTLAERGDVWTEAQVSEVDAATREAYREKHLQGIKNGRPLGIKSGDMMEYRDMPLVAADARVTKGETFLTLEYVAVHPDFWRQGMATEMVRRGLIIADEYKIKTYVTSEPAGLKLYLNLGFKLVETVSTDYSQYGGESPMVHYFLVRPIDGK